VAYCGGGGGGSPFPTPAAVLAAGAPQLRALGLSFAKIASLKDLAAQTLAGVVPDRENMAGLDNDQIIERLTQVRGIGRWTVEMLLMHRLGRPDILPVDDFGVRKGFAVAYRKREMPQPKALAKFGERWKPYRTVASWYFWRAAERASLPAALKTAVTARARSRGQAASRR
ncbi:MAG: DNA-3-methyladenine glycosylase family protein, partial [Stellaceae bacterium]